MTLDSSFPCNTNNVKVQALIVDAKQHYCVLEDVYLDIRLFAKNIKHRQAKQIKNPDQSRDNIDLWNFKMQRHIRVIKNLFPCPRFLALHQIFLSRSSLYWAKIFFSKDSLPQPMKLAHHLSQFDPYTVSDRNTFHVYARTSPTILGLHGID